MKRLGLIGFAVLLTVLALGVAGLAIVRRHHAEARLAGLQAADRATRAAIRSADTRVVVPRREIRVAEASAQSAATASAPANAPVRPDVNSLFAAHPDLAAAYRQATVGSLHQAYDRLWNRMGLSPAQIEQVVGILMRDDENEMDLAMTAQALKLSADDPALRQFREEEKAATNAALASVVGTEGYRTLQEFNRSLALRSTADDVASLTVAAESPMTGEQTERLTQVLAEARASHPSSGRPNENGIDWDAVLTNAAGFLNPAQLTALRAKAQQAKAAALLSQFYASRPPP